MIPSPDVIGSYITRHREMKIERGIPRTTCLRQRRFRCLSSIGVVRTHNVMTPHSGLKIVMDSYVRMHSGFSKFAVVSTPFSSGSVSCDTTYLLCLISSVLSIVPWSLATSRRESSSICFEKMSDTKHFHAANLLCSVRGGNVLD